MMKKILLLLITIIPLAGYAQFDEQFYQPQKAWLEHDLPAFEEVWITEGSDSVHAIWCKPDGKVKAVVFYCHGNYGNISYNAGFIRLLVEDGFAVFAWDYPGFGYSSGMPTHAGIARMGQEAFEVLKARKEVKEKKIILFGLSIGVQVATKLARDHQPDVSALVLDSGMKSFTDMALVSSPEEVHPMIRRFVVSPYSAIEDITYLEGMPKLIMHSREDAIAPFSHSEEMFATAPEPKLFLAYPGGHVQGLVTKQKEVLQIFDRLVE